MAHRRTNSGSSFAVGLLCGAAVGAALGLLFARKSGADLRQDVVDSMEDLKRRARKVYEDASEMADGFVDGNSDLIDRTSEMVDRTVDRTMDMANKVARRARARQSQMENLAS